MQPFNLKTEYAEKRDRSERLHTVLFHWGGAEKFCSTLMDSFVWPNNHWREINKQEKITKFKNIRMYGTPHKWKGQSFRDRKVKLGIYGILSLE